MFTITLVISEDRKSILLCKHAKNNIINFIGGKVDALEDPMNASYHELEEETGITREDINLRFLRQDTVCSWCDTYTLYATVGILNKPVELREKNELFWLPMDDIYSLTGAGYYGDCIVFALSAKEMLNLK